MSHPSNNSIKKERKQSNLPIYGAYKNWDHGFRKEFINCLGGVGFFQNSVFALMVLQWNKRVNKYYE